APGTAVVVSYDSLGKVRWARNYAQLGSTANSICSAQGALFVTGPLVMALRFEPDASVDKVLTNTGNTIGGQSIATDGIGGIFIAGYLPSPMNIGSVTLVNASASLY